MPISVFNDPKRSNNLFNPNPDDIIVREELRGRYLPPTDEQIIGLAISIYENGQKSPCQGVKLPHEGNRIELRFGFSRYAAVKLLREGFEHEGVFYHRPELTLGVLVSSGDDDAESIRENIAENKDRIPTTCLDDAWNIKRLQKCGQTLEQIAKAFRWPLSRIESTVALLGLSDDLKRRVHLGEIPFSAAVKLLEIRPEERGAIIEQAATETKTEGSTKVKGTAVDRVIRERHLTNNPETTEAAPKPKNIARTYSDVKGFLTAESLSGSPRSKSLAALLLGFAAGEISEGDLKSAWDKVLKS